MDRFRSGKAIEIAAAIAEASDRHLKSVGRTASQQKALADMSAKKKGPLTTEDYIWVRENVK